MAQNMGSLEKRFYSHLSPSLLQGVKRVIGSGPFTLACLCILLLPLVCALLFSVAYIPTFLYGVFSGHPFPSRDFFFISQALLPSSLIHLLWPKHFLPSRLQAPC